MKMPLPETAAGRRVPMPCIGSIRRTISQIPDWCQGKPWKHQGAGVRSQESGVRSQKNSGWRMFWSWK